MLLPSDLNYWDFEVVARMSGKGWPYGDWFKEDLLESHEIMLKAIEKAMKK